MWNCSLASYGTAQFKLVQHTCTARAQHDTFFISQACKPACACKTGDVKPTMQSSRVHTRCVHNARVHLRSAHAVENS